LPKSGRTIQDLAKASNTFRGSLPAARRRGKEISAVLHQSPDLARMPRFS
jgi:hypothetical protein